jgi:hypothetical protein
VEGGRVWHNSFRRPWGEREIRYYTHLGTGLAGYPGGQATVVAAAAERLLRSPGVDPAIEDRLRSGASWLHHAQLDDGSWARTYHAVTDDDRSVPLESGAGSAAEGATAEGALALARAAEVLQEPAWDDAAARALRWLQERLAPGMAMGGYLRDNRLEEQDGISAVPVIEALLVAAERGLPGGDLDLAVRAGLYLATWQRWWAREAPSLDPLALSFKPRIAPWETVCAARAYLLLHAATGDELWRSLASEAFAPIAAEDGLEGYSEAIYYDERGRLHPHPMGTTYVAAAVLRLLDTGQRLAAWELPRVRVRTRPHREPGRLERAARSWINRARGS